MTVTRWFSAVFEGKVDKNAISIDDIKGSSSSLENQSSAYSDFTFQYRVNLPRSHFVVAEVLCGQQPVFYVHQVCVEGSIARVVLRTEDGKEDAAGMPYCDGQLIKAVALNEEGEEITSGISWAGILNEARLREVVRRDGRALNSRFDGSVWFYAKLATDQGQHVSS